MFDEAERLKKLPKYVFSHLDDVKAQARAKGTQIIDLGMGNPDLGPPQAVTDALTEAIKNKDNSRYSTFRGLEDLIIAITEWCERQYDIKLNPKDEITPLIGSKEGIVHFIFAFINHGDYTATPNPCYPAHYRATLLSGGIPYALQASEQNNFMPDFEEIPDDIKQKTKVVILSYPTNPTAALATKEYFEKVLALADKNDWIVVHDFAYAELYFDEKNKPFSIFSLPNAKKRAIEFHSFSKTFSMPGWRAGFAVGNPNLIATLMKMKTNLDYGLFLAVQRACIQALKTDVSYLNDVRNIYKARHDILHQGLIDMGAVNLRPSASTMYVWTKCPKGINGNDFALKLIEETGIVVSPGSAFGEFGEDHIRFALVEPKEKVKLAVEKMKKVGIKFS